MGTVPYGVVIGADQSKQNRELSAGRQSDVPDEHKRRSEIKTDDKAKETGLN